MSKSKQKIVSFFFLIIVIVGGILIKPLKRDEQIFYDERMCQQTLDICGRKLFRMSYADQVQVRAYFAEVYGIQAENIHILGGIKRFYSFVPYYEWTYRIKILEGTYLTFSKKDVDTQKFIGDPSHVKGIDKIYALMMGALAQSFWQELPAIHDLNKKLAQHDMVVYQNIYDRQGSIEYKLTRKTSNNMRTAVSFSSEQASHIKKLISKLDQQAKADILRYLQQEKSNVLITICVYARIPMLYDIADIKTLFAFEEEDTLPRMYVQFHEKNKHKEMEQWQ